MKTYEEFMAELPSHDDVLRTINAARKVLGLHALTELPKAVPNNACGCVFSRGLGINVYYRDDPDAHQDDVADSLDEALSSADPRASDWWLHTDGIVKFELIDPDLADDFARALGGESDGVDVFVKTSEPAMRWMLAFDAGAFPELIERPEVSA